MTHAAATIDDLFRLDGKAELIEGRIVRLPPSGDMPGHAADVTMLALRAYVRERKHGHAVGGTRVFRVDLPHRQSFSPDAAFHAGGLGPKRTYFEGAPTFAVEVREDADYGPAAEREMAAKRADYFAAGTLVVWDVDLRSPEVVRVYRATAPHTPTVYRRGDVAETEPAVPGWTMPVDDLFQD